MFGYYFALALHNLRRNSVLTALMVIAIAFGVSASMTIFTLFRAMSSDPIPSKSNQLFSVQIDNGGPRRYATRRGDTEPPNALTYTDASALVRGRVALRQAAMYPTKLALAPKNPDIKPFPVVARATSADFFPMFESPFRFGGGWSKAEDDAQSAVVVLSKRINDKLFDGANSVGKNITLDKHEYRIVGVLDAWDPRPRFYDLSRHKYFSSDDVYLPFSLATAKGHEFSSWGEYDWDSVLAADNIPAGWEAFLQTEVNWIQVWVELPTAEDVQRYRNYLDNYAHEQQRLGRFQWEPNNRLRNVQEWITFFNVVPDDIRVSTLVAFSFLFICLINTIGLMLAKFLSRTSDIGLRRALGATKRTVFIQCIVESGVVGFLGGLLSLVFTALGLILLRGIFPPEIARLAHLDMHVMGMILTLAIGVMILAGLYPTYRAMQIQPAWQLKSN